MHVRMITMADESKIYIRDAALALNRRPATLREWERSGLLPRHLRSTRSERGWRYWSREQIEQIKAWMVEIDLRPGKGLEHYHPTPAQVQAHLEGQRRPRKVKVEGEELVAA